MSQSGRKRQKVGHGAALSSGETAGAVILGTDAVANPIVASSPSMHLIGVQGRAHGPPQEPRRPPPASATFPTCTVSFEQNVVDVNNS